MKKKSRRGGLQTPKPLPRIFCPGVKRRFMSLVHQQADGLWVWKGTKDAKGYGRFWFGKSALCAHRVAYAIFRGDVPEGYTVDHIDCRPENVHPNNLRLLTPEDNRARVGRHCRNTSTFDIPV